MNVLYVFADSAREWNCSEWRCAIPARAINRSTGNAAELLSIAEFASRTGESAARCEWADIIVVQRLLYGQVLDAVVRWRSRGKVVIVDFDDAYDRMPASNPTYRFWGKGEAVTRGPAGRPITARLPVHPLDEFKRGLRLVHAATMPSRLLAADWEPLTHTYFLPNYLDLETYLQVARHGHQEVIIGWGGGGSHRDSLRLSGVFPALERVCARRARVMVAYGGGDPETFDLIPVPRSRKFHLPRVPFAAWPGTLARFDIGIAPLHGEYDQRRSWIKPLEYLVMGIPWVATAGAPYQDLAGYGLLVQNGVQEWTSALMEMVDNLALYRQRAETTGRWQAMMLSVDVNVDRILAVYREICERALDRGQELKMSSIERDHDLGIPAARLSLA